MTAVNPHTLSLQTALKHVDNKLLEIGNGPHTPSQSEEHKKLTLARQKLLLQIQTSMQGGVGSIASSTRAPSIVMQTTKLANSNITLAGLMPKQPVTGQPTQVIINKTTSLQQPLPNFINQANKTAPRDNKLLDKKRLQDLVNEIDPNLQLDDDLEEMLMKVLSDFVDEAVASSCVLAQHRKSNTLEVKDLKLHLEKQWNIFVPGFGSEDTRSNRKTQTTEAHKQRMALIRKANKK